MNTEVQRIMTEVTLEPGACFPMGKGRTWWRVLNVDYDAGTALVIANKEICRRAYHDKYRKITWENCTLRKWLNEEYFAENFSGEEQNAIRMTHLINPDNPKYHTPGGNDTDDRIFLLSIEEAERYFKNDEDRSTGNWWWLRSPGDRCDSAASVHYDGLLFYFGRSVSNDYVAVRPAFEVNLKSQFFQSLITSKSKNHYEIHTCKYEIENEVLAWVNPGLKKVIIGENITEIADGCFKYYTKLETVSFPESLQKIGRSAFENCSKLKSIKLPKSLQKIGKSAFEDCEKLTTVEFAEGLTEIEGNCFQGCKNLKSIVLPSTMKKIGVEAFYGCEKLKEYKCASQTVAYGKDVFGYEWDPTPIEYTSEMFRTTGKLCSSFAEHCAAADAESLSWIILYQKGEVWEDALKKSVNTDNANQILQSINTMLQQHTGSIKKQAEAAAAFVQTNVQWLTSDLVSNFIAICHDKKCGDTADRLTAYPAVAKTLNLSTQSETSESLSDKTIVKDDGTILYGEMLTELKPGVCFPMGRDGMFWRVLDMNSDTALVIAGKEICRRAYHNKWEDVTWENCTLRKWLNEEYFADNFSEEEQNAILMTHLINSDNPEYHTPGGKDTDDRIFLLSIEEAERYFKNDEDRSTGDEWLLRSPGNDSYRAAIVYGYGSLIYYGSSVSNDDDAVRPAFEVNLESEFFQSLITSKSENQYSIKVSSCCIKDGVLISVNPCITSIELPEYVQTITERAFVNCPYLTQVTWRGKMPKIRKNAFVSCPQLQLPAEVYQTSKKIPDDLSDFLPPDPETMAKVLYSQQDKRLWLSAVLQKTTPESAERVAAEILRLVPKNKTLNADQTECLLRFALACGSVLEKETLIQIYDLLQRRKCAGGRYASPWLKQIIDSKKNEKGANLLDLVKVGLQIILTAPQISGELPPLTQVLSATRLYADQYWEYSEGYRLDANSEKAAEEIDHSILMSVLRCWQEKVNKIWYVPYVAYANDAELTEFLKEVKKWPRKKADERETVSRVCDAVILNNTNDAARYMDSVGKLKEYAEMRGFTEAEYREKLVADLGLDSDGRKTIALGDKEYTVCLNKDLSLAIFDSTGKQIKSFSKKGVDPEQYERANNELKELKKDIKDTAKRRNDHIFSRFLSGEEQIGEAWRETYMSEAILKLLAQLVVWEQNKKTFILHSDGKAYDVNDNLYEVTDKPVVVAHPMEMGEELTKQWQEYFVQNNLKQPFEQVWEPVTDSSLVKAGRYDGCTVPLYTLMNKAKHGIEMLGQSNLKLKDCSADLNYIQGYKEWVNNEFEVKNFKFKKYTRQVNHIVTHLDKATVAGRIKKDDISVMQWLDRFTLAQIMDFIDLASKNNATNVCALLMQYKEEHFGGFDAMDEFTLDLL